MLASIDKLLGWLQVLTIMSNTAVSVLGMYVCMCFSRVYSRKWNRWVTGYTYLHLYKIIADGFHVVALPLALSLPGAQWRKVDRRFRAAGPTDVAQEKTFC